MMKKCHNHGFRVAVIYYDSDNKECPICKDLKDVADRIEKIYLTLKTMEEDRIKKSKEIFC